MATGFGLRLVGRLGGGAPRISEYFIPASDGTALYQGDVVEKVNAMDSDNKVPVVTRAATGDILLGVVVGFKPDASLPYTGQYRAASTARYVLVCDDPNAIYEIQEDADGGAVSAANVGESLNADIIVADGSTVTGLSGTMLDSNTVAATAEDLKIIGVARKIDNEAAQSGGAILRVMIVAPALKATDSDS
jgi:hypothetical protein